MRNPSPPKSSIIQISKIELFTVYMPVMQNSMTRGSKILLGILRILAKSGTKGRLSRSRMKLPIYMLAMTPQKSSGCSAIIMGPGVTPWMSSAPSRIGSGRGEGDPQDKEGDEGRLAGGVVGRFRAGHALDGPLPNSSGCFEILLLHHVGGIGGDDRRRPGNQPHAEPDAGPLRMAKMDPLRSWRLG